MALGINTIVSNASARVDHQAGALREQRPRAANPCQPVHAQRVGRSILVMDRQRQMPVENKNIFGLVYPGDNPVNISLDGADHDIFVCPLVQERLHVLRRGKRRPLHQLMMIENPYLGRTVSGVNDQVHAF